MENLITAVVPIDLSSAYDTVNNRLKIYRTRKNISDGQNYRILVRSRLFLMSEGKKSR